MADDYLPSLYFVEYFYSRPISAVTVLPANKQKGQARLNRDDYIQLT